VISDSTTTAPNLKQVASDVLARALKAGATDAEVVVHEGDEFSALVRLGQVETLKESGSRAVGLRVFVGHRTASTSSSDLSTESIERLVDGAVSLARITSEDPFAGLPAESEFGQHDVAAQHLYFEDVNEQPPAERIELARAVEAASMAYDPRIQNSGGGDFDTATSHKILTNSRGFRRSRLRTRPTARCSATIGTRLRARRGCWRTPRLSAKRLRGGLCAVWARDR